MREMLSTGVVSAHTGVPLHRVLEPAIKAEIRKAFNNAVIVKKDAARNLIMVRAAHGVDECARISSHHGACLSRPLPSPGIHLQDLLKVLSVIFEDYRLDSVDQQQLLDMAMVEDKASFLTELKAQRCANSCQRCFPASQLCGPFHTH
jgi:hypothetical protein